ncbi:MAG: nucleotide exchange factor GrpE [bacterium]
MDEKTTPSQEELNISQETTVESNHEKNSDPAQEEVQEEVTIARDVSNQQVDWKSQAAYYAAEIDNIQKRFVRESAELRKYANEELLKKIVPALDTLTLALKAAERAKLVPENESLFSHKLFLSFIQGVEMTAKQFENVLQAAGVEFIKSVGETFDPTIHEALGQANKSDVKDNVITEEFERGLKLHGRIIRPAKVFVNKN